MRRGLHHGISLETSVSDFSGRRQARSVVGDRRRRRNLHFGIVQRQALRHAAQGPQERRQIDQARNFRRTDSCSRGTRPSWCDHGCGAGKTEPRVYYSGAWRYRHGSQRILLRRWHRDRCLRPQGWHPNPHPANARQAQPASTRFPHQQRQCLPQPPQGMAASLPWRRDEEPAQLPWLAPYSGGLGPKDHARGFYLWSDRIRPISTINAIRAIKIAPAAVHLDVCLVNVPTLSDPPFTPPPEIIDEGRRQLRLAIANGLIAEFDSPDQEHLWQIAQAQLVAKAPEDHERDNVGWILSAIENSAAAFNQCTGVAGAIRVRL